MKFRTFNSNKNTANTNSNILNSNSKTQSFIRGNINRYNMFDAVKNSTPCKSCGKK